MPLEISIPEEDVRYLTEPAKRRVREEVVRFANELLAEAGRLEAARSGTTSDPQITDREIGDATIITRRYARRKRSRVLLISGLLAPIGAPLVGVTTSQGLDEAANQIMFVIFITLTLGSVIFNILHQD